MKQVKVNQDKNLKVNMGVVLKRTIIALLILAISSGTGVFFYNRYGKLDEDEVIPYYLNNSFGSYIDNDGYNEKLMNNYNTDLFIDYYFKYGDFFSSDSMGHPIETKYESGEMF